MCRLEAKIGRKPRLLNLLMHTHKKRSTCKFMDDQSWEVVEKYTWLRSFQASAIDANAEVRANEVDDTTLWLQVVGGKNKKGLIFYTRSEARQITLSGCFFGDPSSLHPDLEDELQCHMELVLEQLKTQ